MEINEALKSLSKYSVIIGMDDKGNMKLIKNHSNNEIRCIGDGMAMLYDLFNQETQIEYFNAAFTQDFAELIKKHMKRTCFQFALLMQAKQSVLGG